jgi:hypothetical protein
VIDPLAAGGDAVDLAAPTGTVTPAGTGAARALAFAQDGPSHYVAVLPAAGRAQVDVLDIAAGGTAQRTLVAVPYPAEDVPATPRASVLGGLAQLTGGRVLPDDPAALAPSDGTALWPFLVALALALLVAAAALDARRL